MSLQKNKEYTLEIVDLTYEGFGVAKIDGFPIFIENTLPQEVVVVRLTKILKKFAYGRAMEIVTPSAHRVPITDKVGTRIGTMPLQHMSYALQLQFKKDQVVSALAKMVSIEGVVVHDTLGMATPWGYRNKAQIPVRELQGVLETGFFKRGSHDLIPIENYHIQDPKIDEAILVVRDLLRKYQVQAYDEKRHSGDVRHIIVRRGQFSEELMIILVTKNHKIPALERVAQDIVALVPHVVSVVRNINDKKTNVIMGEVNQVMVGDDFYTDHLMGKKFSISSQSFYQVNSMQTEVLYQSALDLANIKKMETVIDAYCGIGTISLNLADYAKHVYAVEIVPDAIIMAKFNAMENNVDNVTFEVGRAEVVMKQWVEDGLSVDVIVVDPPRRGLDESFIEASVATRPDRIVYVSCNPATLARDVALYDQLGYKLTEVQPVDMFPQTTHVETVARLERMR